MSKMENTKPTFSTHFCDHEDGNYSVTIQFANRHVEMSSAGYASNVNLTIYKLKPEDILEIANAIRKIATDIKPELNEPLFVGAGI